MKEFDDIKSLCNEAIESMYAQKEKALEEYVKNGGNIKDIEIEQYPIEVERETDTNFIVKSKFRIVDRKENKK